MATENGSSAPDGSHNNPFPSKNTETLRQCLRELQTEVRFNLRSRRPEWREANLISNGHDWTPLSDRSTAKIRDDIERRFFVQSRDGPRPLKFGRDAFWEHLNGLLYYQEIDPFGEWLKSLPAWDGEDRIDRLLIEFFSAPKDDLSLWASRYPYLGAVQRTLAPGCLLREIPVFIGPQNIGKSAYLRLMLPPEMPELHSDGLRWDAKPERQIEAVMGRAIVEISEMAGRRRAEIELVKAFISRVDDGSVRLPWARSPESLPRRFVMIGTTNNDSDLPNDPTGNSRFVPIPLTEGKNPLEEVMTDDLRKQLWAEAIDMYQRGMRANLPHELRPAQNERTAIHRDRDDLIEDAVDNLPKTNMTLSEVMEQLPESLQRTMSPHRVGVALRHAGWMLRRSRNKRTWEPPAQLTML